MREKARGYWPVSDPAGGGTSEYRMCADSLSRSLQVREAGERRVLKPPVGTRQCLGALLAWESPGVYLRIIPPQESRRQQAHRMAGRGIHGCAMSHKWLLMEEV